MKKLQLLFGAILSGVLLSLAWPTYGFAPLLFVGFVPLLLVEDVMARKENGYKTIHLFFYAYLTFILWNVIVTWWVTKATLIGGTMAMVCNALLMASVFTMFHVTKKKTGEKLGYFVFIFYWITFEHLHLNWDLSWPWLTLGNGFASNYKWIQWYQYTGVFGGALWILTLNILFFMLVKKVIAGNKNARQFVGLGAAIVLLIGIPIIISYLIYDNYKPSNDPVKVVVVQPNVDPYSEKFSGDYEHQLKEMIHDAIPKLDSTTSYLVFPETALTEEIWEKHFDDSFSIPYLQHFVSKYPKLKIVIGAATYRAYLPGQTPSITARRFTQEKGYYDAYNTALQIDNSKKVQVYHKSKLVPGVEKMPFPRLFKPLEKLAINLGGTTGSLGTQKERSVFKSLNDSMKIAPVVCYESIYGEYLGGYIKNGAELIFIITNDGWWGNTQGYKQHFDYARLRAIETRRSIACSANTGISFFMDQRGDVLQKTKWWVPAVLKGTINANTAETFYTKHGDYIAEWFSYCSMLLFIYTLALILYNRIGKFFMKLSNKPKK